MRMVARVSVLFMVVIGLVSRVQSDEIPEKSLYAPFKESEVDHVTILNEHWKTGYQTKKFKDFVRLTKKGYYSSGKLYVSENIKRNSITTVITFRVSGTGENWSSEGMAIWFADHEVPSYSSSNYGYKNTYRGFGVIIGKPTDDTQNNAKNDVKVQIHSGIAGESAAIHTFGDIKVRYNEDSAAYSPVYCTSRIKITIDGQKLVIDVDPDSSGRWPHSFTHQLPFDQDWLRTSKLGITAINGIADDTNEHFDVFSIKSFTDSNDVKINQLDTDVIVHKMSKDYEQWLDSPSCGEDCTLAILRKMILNGRADAEHRINVVRTKVTQLVDKLKTIERRHKYQLSDIESDIDYSVRTQTLTTKDVLGIELKTKIDKEWQDNSALRDHGWRHALIFFVIMLGIGSIFAYRKYHALMKSHLL